MLHNINVENNLSSSMPSIRTTFAIANQRRANFDVDKMDFLGAINCAETRLHCDFCCCDRRAGNLVTQRLTAWRGDLSSQRAMSDWAITD